MSASRDFDPTPTRRLGQWSLRAALLLCVVLPLGLVAVAGTLLTLQAVEEQAIERMQRDVELVARAIQLPLSRSLEQGRRNAVVTTLESAFRIGTVYGATLYDAEGLLVASVSAGREEEEPDRLEELARGEDRLGEYSEAGGEEIYSYFVPLTGSTGRSLGLLQVARQRSDIDAHVAALRMRSLLLLGLGLVVIGGLVLIGHHGAIGRYLDGLVASMSKVETGMREHRAASHGPREVNRLATGLNTMLDSIARAEAEVRDRRSAQSRLESELREAEKMAAIGRLAAGVAHELGSPLSVVDGKAQRLLRKEWLDEETQAELNGVRGEVRRMEGIIRQLLEFGKGEGRTPRRLHAADIASSALAAVGEEARAGAVDVELRGPRPGPAVMADPARLEGALVNLLRNAVQASPGGRVVLSWRLGGVDEEKVLFEVVDDGPGLPPEVRGRVFEPFFTTKPTGQGTGLGLAVVHGVAEEHEGEARAENVPGGGARFTLGLPRAADASAPAPPDRDPRRDGRRADGVREPSADGVTATGR